eukprot:TRINITY_DN290_c0_g1_i2.p1 TRINITY_DN290_c0_g1~~TRINITY_DN290_c0_g1_i2.p1  ORF type:complete len:287 (+),score=47.18 TRINITY_DN290_c0_g1_i2:69-863(+)
MTPRTQDFVTAHKHRRNNSTATVFISNLICAPDYNDLFKGLAREIQENVKEGLEKGSKRLPRVFDSNYDPNVPIPPMESICAFLDRISECRRLAPECSVLTAYFLDQLKSNGYYLQPNNWARTVLVAMMLSEKVTEDKAVWNVDFLDSVFPNFPVTDMNVLEREFLGSIQYKVNMKPSDYAKFYFILRGDATGSSSKPLDKIGVKVLEAKALARSTKRSNSTPRTPPKCDTLDAVRRANSEQSNISPTSPLSLENLLKFNRSLI